MEERILQGVFLSGLQRFINLKQEPHEPLVKLVDHTNPTFRELHNDNIGAHSPLALLNLL